MELTVGQRKAQVEDTDGGISIDGEFVGVDLSRIDAHTFHAIIDKKAMIITVEEIDRAALTVRLNINGRSVTVQGADRYALLLESLGMSDMASAKADVIKAPMPGLVLEVIASPGMEVAKGDKLIILEAMKMENVIKAPADAVVRSVTATKGVSVEKGDVLVTFE